MTHDGHRFQAYKIWTTNQNLFKLAHLPCSCSWLVHFAELPAGCRIDEVLRPGDSLCPSFRRDGQDESLAGVAAIGVDELNAFEVKQLFFATHFYSLLLFEFLTCTYKQCHRFRGKQMIFRFNLFLIFQTSVGQTID